MTSSATDFLDELTHGIRTAPTVQVLSAWPTTPQRTPVVLPSSSGAMPGDRAALTLLGSVVGVDAWAITRTTEDTWTCLVLQTTARAAEPGSAWASTPAARYPVGTPIALDRSLCHHLLTGPAATVVGDLGRRDEPALRRIADSWGVRGYLGIALTAPDGARVGSLVGLSAAPLQAQDRDWSAMLEVQATALQASLAGQVAALAGVRREAYERGAANLDAVSRLPNRRGWAGLLLAEEEVSVPVGDPVGLALVDLGVVRTARSLRRAVAVVREAAGDVQLARVGPRQLGILAGGLQTSQVTRMAALVQARLEGAGFTTATAHSMRAGLEPLATTWLRVENALVAARRDGAR